jgi:hypothetical protein
MTSKIEGYVTDLMERGRPIVAGMIKDHLDTRPSQAKLREAVDNTPPAAMMPLLQKYGHQDGEQVPCPFCKVMKKQLELQGKRIARETVRVITGGT